MRQPSFFYIFLEPVAKTYLTTYIQTVAIISGAGEILKYLRAFQTPKRPLVIKETIWDC
jgi:hypothetical protein